MRVVDRTIRLQRQDVILDEALDPLAEIPMRGKS